LDPRGLRQVVRSPRLQFFPRFVPKRCDPIILQPIGNFSLFFRAGSLGSQLFLPDISAVLALNLDLPFDLFRKC